MHSAKQHLLAGAAALVWLSLASPVARGQQAQPDSPTAVSESNSLTLVDDRTSNASGSNAGSSIVAVPSAHYSLLQSIGVDAHLGINGVGGDIALPITRQFNVRVGGEYFHYSTSFTEEGANVDASIRLGSGKAALDWYPFRNGFRISPQVRFAIQTQASGTVLVPPGQTISLNNQDYISSNTDPLHGSGLVTTRKSAPGISIGWGNISPRGERRLTFPVELGFYYIGQPNLQVSFTGYACDPAYPQTIGCQSVDQDDDFQASLKAFIIRNQHNVSYASFFPIASFGVGYRF